LTFYQAYANMLFMSPEDFFGPNEGQSQHQHPEVAENVEATMPASEQSKRILVEAIDSQLARKSTREWGGAR
jgi:hypothetical protein